MNLPPPQLSNASSSQTKTSREAYIDQMKTRVHTAVEAMRKDITAAQAWNELSLRNHGIGDDKAQKMLDTLSGRTERLLDGLKASVARVMASDERTPLSIAVIDDPAARERMAALRASIVKDPHNLDLVDAYHLERFPGLYNELRTNPVEATEIDSPAQPIEMTRDIEALESLLSSLVYPSPVHSGTPTADRQSPDEGSSTIERSATRDMTEIARQLVACALVEGQAEGSYEALSSPNLITRALINFGGRPSHYDFALVMLKHNGLFNLCDGFQRKYYTIAPDFLRACEHFRSVAPAEAATRWPTLYQLTELCHSIDPRPVSQSLASPTGEQVTRVSNSLRAEITEENGESKVRTVLSRVLEAYTGTEDGTFAVNLDDLETSAQSRYDSAKRILSRLGILGHIGEHVRTPETLTQLGRDVLADATLWDEILVTTHTSTEAEGKTDQDQSRPNDQGGGGSPPPSTNGHDAPTPPTGVDAVSPPVVPQESSTEVVSDLRKDVYRAITEAIRKYQSTEPRLTDAEAITAVIMEGFLNKNDIVVGRSRRIQGEIMRKFHKSSTSGREIHRFKTALNDLVRTGCVNRVFPKASCSLNQNHELIKNSVIPLLRRLTE